MQQIQDEMKIKALAPWFGGKRTLAPRIVAELGKHTQYFEPFCGGLSVILAKPQSQKETVNDLYGDVINLARVVADQALAPKLYERLSTALFSEDLLLTARDRLEHSQADPDGTDADRAFWYFLASWMGRNGTAGTDRVDYQIAVRWTNNGGSPTVRFRNAVESLPAWHRRLLNVVILCRDAFRIIDRFEDDPRTCIYVDPPYPKESRSNLAQRNGGGGRYRHEFNHRAHGLFAKDDWTRIAEVLSAYKRARIVVSSYDCATVRRLFDGWTFVEHATNKALSQWSQRGSHREAVTELLIINGPSYTEGGAG